MVAIRGTVKSVLERSMSVSYSDPAVQPVGHRLVPASMAALPAGRENSDPVRLLGVIEV
jgi:hypothetical protein